MFMGTSFTNELSCDRLVVQINATQLLPFRLLTYQYYLSLCEGTYKYRSDHKARTLQRPEILLR